QQPQAGGFSPGPSYNQDGTLNTGGNPLAGTVSSGPIDPLGSNGITSNPIGITAPGQHLGTVTADPSPGIGQFPQQGNKATASAAAGQDISTTGPPTGGS